MCLCTCVCMHLFVCSNIVCDLTDTQEKQRVGKRKKKTTSILCLQYSLQVPERSGLFRSGHRLLGVLEHLVDIRLYVKAIPRVGRMDPGLWTERHTNTSKRRVRAMQDLASSMSLFPCKAKPPQILPGTDQNFALPYIILG